jgi:hypothetical protein
MSFFWLFATPTVILSFSAGFRSFATHRGFNHPMMGEPVDVMAPPPAAWHELNLGPVSSAFPPESPLA